MLKFNEFLEANSNKLKDDTVLLIVCNAKSKTVASQNYNDFSIDTEFLSDDELNEITGMAQAQGIPFRIFYDEKDFMENLLLNDSKYFDRFIVYNSAQNGVGPGRKALIPSICKYFNIRYTGSNPYRVCLCRDKFAVYCLLSTENVKVPKSVLYYNDKTVLNLDKNTFYIAKPLYESSSLGITQKNIFKGSAVPYAYLSKLSERMQQPLLIQQFINGYEIEVPVLSGNNSVYVFKPIVLHKDKNSLLMGEEILDYDCIYNDDYFFSAFPDEFDDSGVKSTAEQVAILLGLKGLCRVDFRYLPNGEFYVTDVSTNPHFIKHSSVNFAFKQIGLKDKDILKTLLALS